MIWAFFCARPRVRIPTFTTVIFSSNLNLFQFAKDQPTQWEIPGRCFILRNALVFVVELIWATCPKKRIKVQYV